MVEHLLRPPEVIDPELGRPPRRSRSAPTRGAAPPSACMAPSRESMAAYTVLVSLSHDPAADEGGIAMAFVVSE